MKITLIQESIEFADKTANLAKFKKHFEQLLGKSDLVVLPEMFSTGFCTNSPELAEDMNGQTVDFLKYWAAKGNFAIAGSFIATENNLLFNRAFFVFPDGKIETADKRHLFTMGGEAEFFSQGNQKLIVNYLGINILLLVCYDLRFPVWSRNVDNHYDLLLYVANFPKSRISSWDILLPARAVENQCFVAGVNICGSANNINYCGHSAIYDFYGNALLNCNENFPSIQSSEIGVENLEKFRNKNQFWADNDKFAIKI